MNENMVFWHTPENAVVPQCIDAVVVDDKGILRGGYSGETLEELSLRYRDPKICSMTEYSKMHENALRSDPVSCTEDEFIQALECLPPTGWKITGNVESFKMSERFSGSMTRIYVRSGSKYWSFMDRIDLSHDEIIMRVVKTRHMLCPCCGGRTIGRQWHNQDTGYGLCKNCIDYCTPRIGEDSMKSVYGVRGVHYDLPED